MDRYFDLEAKIKQARADQEVTLLGPGGVGKTRLAFRAAADQERGLADGAWVAELAPVMLPELVPDTVVGALGIRSAEGRSPTERLVAHLRDRQLLLVLDNCEHVQEGAAALAAELLSSCPGVRVLVTSRHALAVPGELVPHVPPLPTPGLDRTAGSPEALMHYDAVRLFRRPGHRELVVVPGHTGQPGPSVRLKFASRKRAVILAALRQSAESRGTGAV